MAFETYLPLLLQQQREALTALLRDKFPHRDINEFWPPVPIPGTPATIPRRRRRWSNNTGPRLKPEGTPPPPPPDDPVPNDYSFAAVTGAARSQSYSRSAPITGINVPVTATVTGPTAQISTDGISWGTSIPVDPDDTLYVRITSSASYGELVTAHVSITGIGADFNVTTIAAPPDDTDPTPITFTPVPSAELSTPYVSNPGTVLAIDAPAPISVTGGQYSINGGPPTSAQGFVNLNDTVRAHGTSSAAYSTPINVVVTIGTIPNTYTITTKAAPSDNVPDPHVFVDPVLNAELSTYYYPNPWTLAGIDIPANLTVSGGLEYAIDCPVVNNIPQGPWLTAPTTVELGETVYFRLQSSASYSTQVDGVVDITGVGDTYTITTKSDPGGGGTTPLDNPAWVVADYGAEWHQVELLGSAFDANTYQTILDETNYISVSNSTELQNAINTARSNTSINAIYLTPGQLYSLPVNTFGTFSRPRANPLVVRTAPGAPTMAQWGNFEETKGASGIAFIDIDFCPNWPAAFGGKFNLIGWYNNPAGPTPKHILIERCRVWPSIQGINGPNNYVGLTSTHVALRLNWICDNWGTGTSLRHGIYSWNTAYWLIEGNFIDHNGWDPSQPRSNPSTSGGPSNRRHGYYNNRPSATDLGYPASSALVFRYNIVSRSSGNALQSKAIIDARRNLFIRNPLNQVTYGGDGQFGLFGQCQGGKFWDNVTIDTDIITTGNSQGGHLWISCSNGLHVKNNLCIDSTVASKVNECGYYLERDYPLTNVTIENHKQYSWAGTVLYRGANNYTPDVTFNNNDYTLASFDPTALALAQTLKSDTYLDNFKQNWNRLGVDINALRADLSLLRQGAGGFP